MFVFIAHAEADQAAAVELKTFLKRRGLIAETETGEGGFRYLQPTDVVVALWSKDSVFAVHRMQIERRMLDAWAEGRLVLVKLDHSVLPVGVRDLPAIDATFVQARDLNGWQQTERAIRTAINHAVAQQAAPGASPQAGPAPVPALARKTALQLPRVAEPPKSGGATGLVLITLALVAVVAATWYYHWELPGVGAEFQSLVLIGGAVAHVALPFAAVSLLSHVSTSGETRRRARAAATAESRSVSAFRDELADAPAESEDEPERAATAVFISYSHSDNAAVGSVVKVARDNGREVWIDKSGIQAGDSWAGEIVRAIKGARGMMVMCSKRAFESDHVKRELYLAERYKKPMQPIFLEDARPPEDFEYFFAGVQWLELYKVPEAERPHAIGRALEAV